MIRIQTAIFLGLSMSSLAVYAADYYKWVDENGQVNYSQTKPPTKDFSKVAPPPPLPSVTYDLNQKFAEQIRQRSSGGSTTGTSSSQNMEQCETARKNLQALQSSTRVKYTDESGNTVVMPDNVKQQKMKESKEQVFKFCQ